MLTPIAWTGTVVRLLDQTKLPLETDYVDVTDEKQMHDAIRRLVVRGAPAIGISAAFGAYLGVWNFVDDDPQQFFARLKGVCDYLATSRPTAVNLSWALDRIQRVARQIAGDHVTASPACQIVRDIQDAMLTECLEMIEEDHRLCRAIGRHGLKFLDQIQNDAFGKRGLGVPPERIVWKKLARDAQAAGKSKSSNPKSPIQKSTTLLTHCNAGGLATAGYGTALAPVYFGIEQGRQFHVFADETRPLLQGSRITAYELKQNNVPVTVICDSTAAVVLAQKKIDAVIVGADRIAANADTANKIGTLCLAIAAKYFDVPFLVAAPMSTIDFQTPTGDRIPIEQRSPTEIANFGSRPTAPPDVEFYNPAFDVTPAALITAIITDRGVATAPFEQSLRDLNNRA